MKTLDKSRPYGVISGIGESHRYEQDGAKFDSTGQEIVHDIDANGNGYLSIPEIKAELERRGVEVSPKNNNRTSLLTLLEESEWSGK